MMVQGKKFLLIGGASLAGSHIADALLAEGAGMVRIFDNYSLGVPDAVAHLRDNGKVDFVKGDMLRLSEVLDACEGVDGIFLIAAYLAGPIAANPRVGIEVNTLGVLNVLEASRIKSIQRIVYSSSVGVYGNAVNLDAITEESPMTTLGMGSVMTVYSASKLLSEGLLRMYHEKYGIEYVALRYSSIYGPRQHTHSINALAIVEIYENIKQGKSPEIDGDGEEVHDYLYVGDLAQANVKAMICGESAVAVTIASGRARSVNDVARVLLKLLRSDLVPRYRSVPGRLKFTQSTRLNYDISRASAVLGWKPACDLETGIKAYVDWRERSSQVN